MLVSERLCLGCRYYRRLEAAGCMCCHYCHDTGRSRPTDGERCPVKKLGVVPLKRRIRPRL